MNQDKTKARFNFVDAIIIVIIVAVVGAAIYLIATGNQEARKTENGNISYTVRISAVDETYLSFIKEGETVKDSASGKILGTIESIRTEKTKFYGDTAIPSENGYTISSAEYPDKYDVYVTITAMSDSDKRDIHYVSGNRILVGSTIYFKVPSFVSVSYITDFSVITN